MQGAFSDNLVEEMRKRPKFILAELAPRMINVMNVQTFAAPNYITNLQDNIYQSTQKFHQNTLNYINNTSNRVVNIGGSLASAYNNLPDPTTLLAVVNGGSPPPPPAPGAAPLAIRDRPTPYGPAVPIRDRPTAYKPRVEPLALADKPRPVIKKPKIFDPPKRPLPILLDPPPRTKPRGNKEILAILDDIGPASKRPRSTLAPFTTLAIRNRLRVVPS